MTSSKRVTLLTVAALATFGATALATEASVLAHTHVPSVSASQGTFSFTATVLGDNGLALADKEVTLTDITGSGQVLTARTDERGAAIFQNLPVNASFSVSVDGVVQGYTIRSGVADEHLTASFRLAEAGVETPVYSTEPILVTVQNEEAEALSGQLVELRDPSGQVVGRLETLTSGQASFSENLVDGTFYDVLVNGRKKTSLRPGQSRVVFLASDELTSAPSPTVNSGDELEIKRAYVARGAGVDISKVVLLETPNGQALMYPHGDHHHVILLADIDVTKPFDDGHSHDHDHDHNHHDHDLPSVTGQFSFTATVIDEVGRAIAGRVVTLVDITTGENKVVATGTTNEQGRVVLPNLPLLRNLSVLVDEQAQGHTVRTGQDGDERFGTFIVTGQGAGQPIESLQPVTIIVRDEEARGLSGQTVVLKTRNGRLVAEAKTDSEGRVVFTKGLLDGLLYEVWVNGRAKAQVFTGQERSVALDITTILKPGQSGSTSNQPKPRPHQVKPHPSRPGQGQTGSVTPSVPQSNASSQVGVSDSPRPTDAARTRQEDKAFRQLGQPVLNPAGRVATTVSPKSSEPSLAKEKRPQAAARNEAPVKTHTALPKTGETGMRTLPFAVLSSCLLLLGLMFKKRLR